MMVAPQHMTCKNCGHPVVHKDSKVLHIDTGNGTTSKFCSKLNCPCKEPK